MRNEANRDGQLLLAHHHPGRLRVRSSVLERDGEALEAIESWLKQQPGVRAVCSHAPTGSILITYDPSEADPGELLVAIASQAHLEIAERPAGRPPVQAVFAAFRAFDDAVLESSGGRWGLDLVLPVALGIGSAVSFLFSAHRRAPRWDSLLYWGVQAFRAMNDEPHPDHRPGRGPQHAGGR